MTERKTCSWEECDNDPVLEIDVRDIREDDTQRYHTCTECVERWARDIAEATIETYGDRNED